MKSKEPKILADITVSPVGVGTSIGKYVRKTFLAMNGVRGVKLEPTAMSTIIEADNLDAVISVLKKAHSTLLDMGAKRISINLRIDHRLDKPETMDYKLARIKGEL